ncbi:DoxX family membrane protein [Robertkochia aurantiaca]|uniref:DoxX family membrane protein n=1 Tax=Robertkochia aurantiaca TaxID=2873700 RepID=UPI001CC98213|nr:DoxX family membrane protein [Robertkochia sp. 3YJGBD-33]
MLITELRKKQRNEVSSELDNSSNCLFYLRVSLGIIFIWFGVLKFFPALSSAEDIAGKTILKLTFGYIEPFLSIPLLAFVECLIGIGLLINRLMRFVLILLYIQLLGTMSPLFLFPELTFSESVLVPTLLGQYIIKNLVLLSAAIVIGATNKK